MVIEITPKSSSASQPGRGNLTQRSIRRREYTGEAMPWKTEAEEDALAALFDEDEDETTTPAKPDGPGDIENVEMKG